MSYRRAFIKGGGGCLGAFVALGLLALLVGGTFTIDLGGALVLFVFGGLIGLVVFAIYDKGRRDARRERT